MTPRSDKQTDRPRSAVGDGVEVIVTKNRFEIVSNLFSVSRPTLVTARCGEGRLGGILWMYEYVSDEDGDSVVSSLTV